MQIFKWPMYVMINIDLKLDCYLFYFKLFILLYYIYIIILEIFSIVQS